MDYNRQEYLLLVHFSINDSFFRLNEYLRTSVIMFQNFTRNIKSNTLQLVINQLSGLLIFYLLSKGLDKPTFGVFNWSLAVLLTSFNILSFGIDQLIIKKIASGESVSFYLSFYLYHVLTAGTVFYLLLLSFYVAYPDAAGSYPVLLLLGIGKLMLFFATPFKQVANGLEKFNLLARMSVCASVIKGCGLAFLYFFSQIQITYVVAIYMVSEIIELLLCLYLSRTIITKPFPAAFNRQVYKQLIKESLPQVGVVLFSSALARFDWIFIGLFVSASKLAEYSFAYKVFEMATLPLLVLAPLLVPLFVRVLKEKGESESGDYALLLKAEIMLASLIALLLNGAWTPVIDFISDGKYGSVNRLTIFILSLSMPVLYLNNFLWSINFAKGELKMILMVFAVTFGVNIVGDLILIPLFKNEGAAIAYLFAVVVQAVLYLKNTRFQMVKASWKSLLICAACALLSGYLAQQFFVAAWAVVPAAITFYLLALILTAQLSAKDWSRLKGLLKRQ